MKKLIITLIVAFFVLLSVRLWCVRDASSLLLPQNIWSHATCDIPCDQLIDGGSVLESDDNNDSNAILPDIDIDDESNDVLEQDAREDDVVSSNDALEQDIPEVDAISPDNQEDNQENGGNEMPDLPMKESDSEYSLDEDNDDTMQVGAEDISTDNAQEESNLEGIRNEAMLEMQLAQDTKEQVLQEAQAVQIMKEQALLEIQEMQQQANQEMHIAQEMHKKMVHLASAIQHMQEKAQQEMVRAQEMQKQVEQEVRSVQVMKEQAMQEIRDAQQRASQEMLVMQNHSNNAESYKKTESKFNKLLHNFAKKSHGNELVLQQFINVIDIELALIQSLLYPVIGNRQDILQERHELLSKAIPSIQILHSKMLDVATYGNLISKDIVNKINLGDNPRQLLTLDNQKLFLHTMYQRISDIKQQVRDLQLRFALSE